MIRWLFLAVLALVFTLPNSHLLAKDGNDRNNTDNTNSSQTNDQKTVEKGIFTKDSKLVYTEFSIIFVASLNGGINFNWLDEEALEEKYEAKIQDTISYTFAVKLGTVLQYHWLAMLSYVYSKREDYDYRDNYFEVNQTAYEARSHYALALEGDYFLWNYLDDYNVSLGLGVGWLRKKVLFSTIDDVAGGKEITSSETQLSYDYFMTTTGVKFYKRLRETGTIYFGVYYKVLIPTGEHYPFLVAGIDVNLDLTPPINTDTNPFYDGEDGPTDPDKRRTRPAANQGKGYKGELKKGVGEVYKGLKEVQEKVE